MNYLVAVVLFSLVSTNIIVDDVWDYSYHEIECFGRGVYDGSRCDCDPGFFGEECEIISCYDIFSNNSEVCNGRGICVNPDSCLCDRRYQGLSCNVTGCFGELSSSNSSCHFPNGICVANDDCLCSSGYDGDDCRFYICFNLSSSNPEEPCHYPNGTCIGPDICDCNYGYSGPECMDHLCYGKNSSEPEKSFACNFPHGSCVNVDHCECENDYVGLECEHLLCYGLGTNESDICAGHGTCVGFNNCTCNTPWLGDECGYTECNGVLGNNESVCSGNGGCVDLDVCSCIPSTEWGGIDCEIVKCDDVLITDGSVCSGVGNCSSETHECLCPYNRKGPSCQWPKMLVCNNINENDTRVCNGRGNCTKPDLCTCENDYGGNDCHIVKCYGILRDNSSVCNGNGECLSDHTCDCTSSFDGEECATGTCYGVSSFNESVCSGHGNCSNVDTCECESDWGSIIEGVSSMCKVPFCYGKVGSARCSGRGICKEDHTCDCEDGWDGLECEIPTCWGVAPGPFACNQHGDCIDRDQCQCDDDYFGTQCSSWFCYGTEKDSSEVCSSRGECISPGECICNSADYYGALCEKFRCYGKVMNDPSVCNNPYGTCEDVNFCACDSGYLFMDCSTWKCGDYYYNETKKVCSNHGTCVQPSSCVCDNAGYYSDECEFWKCNGKVNVQLDVCGGHGECTDINTCDCVEGWGLDTNGECLVPLCFGRPGTDVAVCSSHGNCTSPDVCQCSYLDNVFGYGGDNCSECAPDFKGVECDERHCDPATTCYGHGSCSPSHECICTGTFSGTYCDICIADYFGVNCDYYCNDKTDCHSHGTCSQSGCTCLDTDIAGHFDMATNCSSCYSPWDGASCTTFLDPDFTFSNEFDRIVGVFKYAPYEEENLDCTTFIVNEEDRLKVGVGSRCRWIDNIDQSFEEFEIVFGQNPTIMPGDQLVVNALVKDGLYKEVTINTLYPKNPIRPTAVLRLPKTIGICDELELDGMGSVNVDGRKLKFYFNVTAGCNVTRVNDYLHGISRSYDFEQPRITLTSDVMKPACPYTFELVVESAFGLKSLPVSLSSQKVFTSVPIARIQGSEKKSVKLSTQMFTLDGYVEECGEVTSNPLLYSYSWTLVRGPKIFPSKGNGGQRFIFPKGTFLKLPTQYEYKFTVTVKSNTTIKSSVNVIIETIASALMAKIEGGDREVSTFREVIIDAVESFDPDEVDEPEKYKWGCRDMANLSPECTNILSLSTIMTQIIVPAQTLPQGVYNISLSYTKGGRVGNTHVILSFTEDLIPTVQIGSIPAYVNPNTIIVLYGFAELVDGTPVYRGGIQWLINGKVPSVDIIFTSTTQSILGIKGNVLKPGNNYKFTMVFTMESGRNVSSSVFTKVNTPPRPGILEVFPMVGYSYQTTITMRALYWSDEHLPLSYSFYIKEETDLEAKLLIPDSDNPEAKAVIPGTGNITIIAQIRDGMGSFSRVEQVIQLLEPIMDDQSLNDTITGLLQQARRQQTFSKCFVPLMTAAKFLSQAGPLISDISVLNFYSYQMKLTYQFCRSVDEFYVATQQTVNQEVQTLRESSSTLVVGNDQASAVVRDSIANLDVIVSLPSDVLDLANIGLVGQVFSNSLGSLDSIGSAENLTEVTNMGARVMEMLERTMLALASHNVVGSNATVIETDSFKVISQQVYSEEIGDTTVEEGGIEISLSNSLTDSFGGGDRRSGEGGGGPTEVDMLVNVYQTPPVNTGQNVKGSVFSLLFSKGRDKMEVGNLTEPMIFTIPSDLAEVSFEDNPRIGGIRPFCTYFDNKTKTWITDGCEVVEVRNSSIVCACTHTSDFTTVVEYGTPSLNVLGAQDFENVTKLSVDNMTALIYVCIMGFLYLLICGMLQIWPLMIYFFKKFKYAILEPFGYSREEINKLEGADRQGLLSGKGKLVKDYLVGYLHNNIWYSVIFQPRDEFFFPRAQRVTVIYIIVLTVSLSNALTYGQKQQNFLQMVVAAVASDILVIPSGIINLMFKKIDVKRPGLIVLEDKIEEEEEDIDLEEGASLGFVGSCVRNLNLMLHGVEVIVKTIKDWVENSTILVTFSLAIIAVTIFLYFCLVVFMDIAALFVMTWMGELGCIVISMIAIDAFVIFFGVIFFYNKRKKFLQRMRDGEYVEWSSVMFKAINLVIVGILWVMCIAAFIICLELHFMTSIPFFWLIPVELGVALIVVSSLVWLFSVFVSPGKKKKKKRKSRKKRKKKKKKSRKDGKSGGGFRLPHPFTWVAYFISFVIILTWSFLIVVYGIKFDSDPNLPRDNIFGSVSADWLLGSTGSVSSNVNISAPIKYVAKTVSMYCLVLIFTQVFLNF